MGIGGGGRCEGGFVGDLFLVTEGSISGNTWRHFPKGQILVLLPYPVVLLGRGAICVLWYGVFARSVAWFVAQGLVYRNSSLFSILPFTSLRCFPSLPRSLGRERMNPNSFAYNIIVQQAWRNGQEAPPPRPPPGPPPGLVLYCRVLFIL